MAKRGPVKLPPPLAGRMKLTLTLIGLELNYFNVL